MCFPPRKKPARIFIVAYLYHYLNIDQYQIRNSAHLSRISTFELQPNEVRVAEGLTDKEKSWDNRIFCKDIDELLAHQVLNLPVPNFAITMQGSDTAAVNYVLLSSMKV